MLNKNKKSIFVKVIKTIKSDKKKSYFFKDSIVKLDSIKDKF
jgi:hypothetical protein